MTGASTGAMTGVSPGALRGAGPESSQAAGLGARVLGYLRGGMRGGKRREPRLALLERIALAPRQSLALVEAEGRRFLVATSQEGGPAFYALDRTNAAGTNVAGTNVAGIGVNGAVAAGAGRMSGRKAARVSW